MIQFSSRRGKYGCFSNFANAYMMFDGAPYQNSEAAFQAQKCKFPEDKAGFYLLSASAAKQHGRVVPLREDWEEVKYDIMVDVLRAKFSQNSTMKEVLLSTGDEELLENTTGWHDNTWGSCSCSRCAGIPGKNLLGKALMQVRSELRASD